MPIIGIMSILLCIGGNHIANISIDSIQNFLYSLVSSFSVIEEAIKNLYQKFSILF